MHVFDTYKFEMDQIIKSNREKVATSFFGRLRAAYPIVRNQNCPNFETSKLLYMAALHVSMKMIRSKTEAKKLQHSFAIISIYKRIHSHGKLTPRSVIRSGRISNPSGGPSEISCMYEKNPIKYDREKVATTFFVLLFFHYNPMEIICCHI